MILVLNYLISNLGKFKALSNRESFLKTLICYIFYIGVIPKALKMVLTASLCDALHTNEFELGK